jgi:hypothetical protein
MVRFKSVDMSPCFLPIVLEQQITPGTFEHALQVLIDTEFDLAPLHAKYINDDIAAIFTEVILICDRQGLIGRELFAIDGVKLPVMPAKHAVAPMLNWLIRQIVSSNASSRCCRHTASKTGTASKGRQSGSTRSISNASMHFTQKRSWSVNFCAPINRAQQVVAEGMRNRCKRPSNTCQFGRNG